MLESQCPKCGAQMVRVTVAMVYKCRTCDPNAFRNGGIVFLNRERVENVIERLTNMAEYAEASLSPEMILWDRMEALRHMLRGEIARLSDWTWINEQKVTTGAPNQHTENSK